MENWAQIRQMYFNQQMSIRGIAKALGINRRTVKRAISTSGGPHYKRQVPYQSMLDPFKAEIRQMIESSNGKLPATVIYSKLCQREPTADMPVYQGSYQTLWRYVRQLKVQLHPKEAFLRIETPPGFDSQCDWAGVELIINGHKQKLCMFVLTLCYSRYRFACLFPTERQECFFEGHIKAFCFFEGVPKQVTYDNLKIAVLKVLMGKNRTQQQAFIRFRGEFPFAANFAAPGKGNEKGKVETDIKYIRNHAFGLDNTFDTLDSANAHLLAWLKKDATRLHSTHKEVIVDRYQKEKPSLSPLRSPMPEGCRMVYAKVNKFSFAQFETNRYSVPTEYVYQTVLVKAFSQQIVIVKDEKIIAKHERLFLRYSEQINPYHFLSLLEKKARAVDHAVVMQSFDLDASLYRLKEALSAVSENPNREWIGILRLSETYPMEALVFAVKKALAYGVCDSASIKNFLIQHITPAVSIEKKNCLINQPQLAAMVVEPRALSGYDALLQGGRTDDR